MLYKVTSRYIAKLGMGEYGIREVLRSMGHACNVEIFDKCYVLITYMIVAFHIMGSQIHLLVERCVIIKFD
jgi:hypothetical protein